MFIKTNLEKCYQFNSVMQNKSDYNLIVKKNQPFSKLCSEMNNFKRKYTKIFPQWVGVRIHCLSPPGDAGRASLEVISPYENYFL